MSKNSLSIIIVSYNVQAFLLNALESLQRALVDISHEIIVVDNNSDDGSVQMLKDRYPVINLIANNKNHGFAAANNQGLHEANGEYLVLINPDTVVQEDTFTTLLQFMKTNPKAGAVTCKILNPDGSFSIDSRHSIPSPMTAFWKQIGFSRLFPTSKTFARYNMTYLNEDEIHKVDAISGSFMFIRAEAAADVGPLDEDFFMYCEDVDYCYRIGRSGWQIYYVPESSIIHYKGESTKKKDLAYARNFNYSLYLFYKKHFYNNLPFLRGVIFTGVLARGGLTYLKNTFLSVLQVIQQNLRTIFHKERFAHQKISTILVCAIEEAAEFIDKIEKNMALNLNITGLVTLFDKEKGKKIAETEVVATIRGISSYCDLNQVEKIILSPKKISYTDIIDLISDPTMRGKECYIIPPNTNLIVGQGNVIELK